MRVPDQFLDCAIYLYYSASNATSGTGGGGSGFLVGVPAKKIAGSHFIFAVTNQHVIEAGADVIRLNMKDGRTKIFETDPRKWIPHPHGDDLAVIPITLTEDEKYAFVPTTTFVTAEIVSQESIGPGDSVFVVGRFINHEGKQRNTPSLRFGNLAQMANEPIKREDNFMQDSFLVEAKSIGGYSGSPVFLYIDGMQPRLGSGLNSLFTGIKGPWLLGVDWSHLNDWMPVCDAQGKPVGGALTPPWNMQVGSNTGMMGVVPAWKLAEIFATKKLQDEFAAVEDKLLEAEGPPPVSVDLGKR